MVSAGGHGGTGALSGGVVGALVLGTLLASNNCLNGTSPGGVCGYVPIQAIIFVGAGAGLGAIIGGSVKTWERRVP